MSSKHCRCGEKPDFRKRLFKKYHETGGSKIPKRYFIRDKEKEKNLAVKICEDILRQQKELKRKGKIEKLSFPIATSSTLPPEHPRFTCCQCGNCGRDSMISYEGKLSCQCGKPSLGYKSVDGLIKKITNPDTPQVWDGNMGKIGIDRLNKGKKMKIKLKTVLQLTEEGAYFDNQGNLVNHPNVDVYSKSINKLGGTFIVKSNDGGTYKDDDGGVWNIDEIKEFIKEENKMKVKLKSVQKLMLEGAVFNEDDELANPDNDINIHIHHLHLLGKTFNCIDKKDSGFNLDISNMKNPDATMVVYEWMIEYKEEILEEENQTTLKEYSLKDNFNFYLTDDGALKFFIKNSECDVIARTNKLEKANIKIKLSE